MTPNAYISSYNVVTPFGIGIDVNLNAILDDRSAISWADKSEAGEDFAVPYWGRIPWSSLGYDNSKYFSKNDFLIEKLVLSIRDSISDRPLDAVIVSDLELSLEEFIHNSKARVFKNMNDFQKVFVNRYFLYRLLRSLNVRLKKESILTLNNTCTTGVSMMAMAEQYISAKKWNRVLLLTIDLGSIYGLLALKGLGALNTTAKDPTTASRPFDKARAGFVKSQGGAIALVASAQDLKKQSVALPLLGLLKACHTSDAFRLTDGRDDAYSAKRAIEQALIRSELKPEQIGFVKAHGTGTVLNDKHEAHALESIFKKVRPDLLVTSLKGHLGHTTDASGLIETLIAGYGFHSNTILPIKNLAEPAFDLNFPTQPICQEGPNYFISTNIGFGGNNSCIALKENKGQKYLTCSPSKKIWTILGISLMIFVNECLVNVLL